MKDQELRNKLHAYRPPIDDNEAFMDKLMAQMDAVDEKQQHASVIPLYRRVLLWAAGVAAAVVIVVFIMREPVTTPRETSCEPRLPEYYYKTPSPISEQDSPTRSLSDFSSYEDIVNEIERSGRQLEDAIAQL